MDQISEVDSPAAQTAQNTLIGRQVARIVTAQVETGEPPRIPGFLTARAALTVFGPGLLCGALFWTKPCGGKEGRYAGWAHPIVHGT
jgi:hypothetical protein